MTALGWKGKGPQDLANLAGIDQNEVDFEVREEEFDGKVRLNELSCDGILVSTPAGSTAYNLSAHGPILPIGSALLAMTPLSPFRPRRWRGALLPRQVQIRFDILEPEKRPVSATADNLEVRDVTRVDVAADRSREMTMLFDAGHSLDERVLAEQFLY